MKIAPEYLIVDHGYFYKGAVIVSQHRTYRRANVYFHSHYSLSTGYIRPYHEAMKLLRQFAKEGRNIIYDNQNIKQRKK